MRMVMCIHEARDYKTARSINGAADRPSGQFRNGRALENRIADPGSDSGNLAVDYKDIGNRRVMNVTVMVVDTTTSDEKDVAHDRLRQCVTV